jgi:hypothetical protein
MAQSPPRLGLPGTELVLKAARLRAGYRSATDAAVAIGISENTLRGHESGKRKISEGQAAAYAKAFKIDRESLLRKLEPHLEHPLIDEIRELSRSVEREALGAKTGQWARLRFARVMRGFATLSDASRRFGLSRGTAGNHENGDNLLSDGVADAYALAYAINAAWLNSGEGPSGFGAEVDARIKGVSSRDLPELARKLDSVPLHRPASEWALIKQTFTDAMASTSFGGRILEMKIGPDGKRTVAEPRQVWVIPQDARTILAKRGATDVIAVSLEAPTEGFEIGDRLFVDLTQRNPRLGGLFVHDDGRTGIFLREHRAVGGRDTSLYKPVGKVLGVFRFI